jgi:hypothetical protein
VCAGTPSDERYRFERESRVVKPGHWIGSAVLLVTVIGATVGCSGTGSGDESTTSSSVTSPPSSTSASVTEGPTGSTGATGATGSTTGWTPQQEAQAASIIADGIKHKFPLERRIAAGHCTVDALKTRETFDSYDTWFAIWVKDENPGALLVATGVLEDCETQVGI